jgi:hypothetical protein
LFSLLFHLLTATAILLELGNYDGKVLICFFGKNWQLASSKQMINDFGIVIEGVTKFIGYEFALI